MNKFFHHFTAAGVLLALVSILSSCTSNSTIKTGDLTLKVNEKMQVSISSAAGTVSDGYSDFDAISFAEGNVSYSTVSKEKKVISDEFGNGVLYIFKGEGNNGEYKIGKELHFSVYVDFPSTIVSQVIYTNLSSKAVTVKEWIIDDVKLLSNGSTPSFWSFQGESTGSRNDWLLPIGDEFFQKNYMGMNDSDYGGGIPVTCIWRKDLGVAIGHLEPMPELVSLPVSKKAGENFVKFFITKEYENGLTLEPSKSVSTLKTFIHLFKGDCFLPLRNYALLLEKVGVVMPESEPYAFESAWCAWGYERKFTIEEILGTLDKVKELGIKWATIDDGFQIAEGDWDLNKARFPKGDADMKRMVDAIHKAGMKAQLWWAPMAADPGTKFLKQHPNSIIINKDGKPQDISWWDSWYLSPTDPDVLAETKRLVEKFIGEYGFDGLKLDGQHMNAVPEDYNPAHNLSSPEQSCQMLPGLFETIYETARGINPHAVIQNCPCGCCISIYNLAWANQTVASDPLNSWQVRTKGYVLRAIAPKTAYYGDHVELSDNANDFPTQLGIGSVLGTKFTYPKDNPFVKEKKLLTPEREKVWKNAFNIYNQKMLSTGSYVPGLYDIGFDAPETHVIKKDGKLYYAFYTDEPVSSVELRGLEKGKTYKVTDYYHNIDLGEVTASDHTVLNVDFKDYLLIETTYKN